MDSRWQEPDHHASCIFHSNVAINILFYIPVYGSQLKLPMETKKSKKEKDKDGKKKKSKSDEYSTKVTALV